MLPIKILSVTPNLPQGLEPLRRLAYNYLFAWNADIEDLFSQIDHKLWQSTSRNPVQFLNNISQETLLRLAQDSVYKERLAEADAQLTRYLSAPPDPDFHQEETRQPVVAYFSLEFGVSSCLPVYSGGLGILAGDHLKSASDLNLPLIGIGLAYRQGYFRQAMTSDGWQQERYPDYDFEQIPLTIATGPDNEPAVVSLNIGERPLYARIWKAQVGRVPLYLLDTDIAQNPPDFREITARLYGGGLEMRLWQEILIGIGGIKALEALGLAPKVIHMNEGHSAFAGLERVRLFMKDSGLPFEAAQELAASSSVFTTHTPVPAGNDRFPPDLMQRHFESYAQELGLAFKVFLALGRENPHDDHEPFCMTVLALRLSRFNNGVSKLHGHVSRNMWKQVWQQCPVEDVPIGALTNGVHAPSWVAPDIQHLFDRHIGPNWREDPDCERVWGQADSIADVELWRTHERLRARLVDYVRNRLVRQRLAQGAPKAELQDAQEVLDPETLTIGFSRRFATYKRANLLLQDKERLIRLMSDKKRPVQFIFAGKAHPQDQAGKQLIQEIIAMQRIPECRYSMVFLEDYNMDVASYLVAGCDIWLNTPRRPLEACGTSGMKAMLNGVLQLSTLDGWWAEAHLPDNSLGWAIGKGEEYDDLEYQDSLEIHMLYNVLENDIIPCFYERGRSDMPRAWVRRMKKAIRQLGPRFNSHRMVEDYKTTAYLPAYENYLRLTRDGFAPARELAAWRMDMMTRWGQLAIASVQIHAQDHLHVGHPVSIEAQIALNGIRPRDVCIEIYAGPVDQNGAFAGRNTSLMEPVGETPDGLHIYRGQATPVDAGRFGFTVRALPSHPLLLDPHSLGLIRWASSGN